MPARSEIACRGSGQQRSAIALAGLMAMASVAPLVWLEARPRDPLQVAAVFAPWAGREEALARTIEAGGRMLRQGAFGNILVARGEADGFIARLYAAGAWAVVDPVAFGGCLAPSRE